MVHASHQWQQWVAGNISKLQQLAVLELRGVSVVDLSAMLGLGCLRCLVDWDRKQAGMGLRPDLSRFPAL